MAIDKGCYGVYFKMTSMIMKNLTTQIIVLVLLFVFPSVSHSTTFKCEFIQEKFKGGKTNEIICTGEPEYGFIGNSDRNKYCLNTEVTQPNNYEDYIDFDVDLDKKTIYWTSVFGRSKSEKVDGISRDILSFDRVDETVSQWVSSDEHNIKNTSSYLITFGQETLGKQKEYSRISSLYIPESGKSILTDYNTSGHLHNPAQALRAERQSRLCFEIYHS